MTPFRFVDLFAGIGGFHAALASQGGECVLACDIDRDCRDVYSENFAETPLFGAIEDLTASRSMPPHDLLCAGFPCQPFSKSGSQLGLRDKTRGTLFFQIMEVIRQQHPRYLMLENVRNLLGPRHRDTWKTILASLLSEGYRVVVPPVVFSPHLLPPTLGGAPQVRERVFILAEHVGVGGIEPGPLVPPKPLAGWDPARWRLREWLQRDAEIPRLAAYALRSDEVAWIEAWNDFVKLIDGPMPGFPVWVDAFVRRAVVDASMPDWERTFRRKNSELYQAHQRRIDAWRRRHNVDAFPPSRRKFEWQAQDHARDLWKLLIHMRPSGIRVKAPTYVPALVAITQTSIVGWRRRRITPREAARLQGFPDSHKLHANDAVAYRQLGNAVNVGVVRFLARQYMNRPGEADQLVHALASG